jgi:hypothetical protein
MELFMMIIIGITNITGSYILYKKIHAIEQLITANTTDTPIEYIPAIR